MVVVSAVLAAFQINSCRFQYPSVNVFHPNHPVFPMGFDELGDILGKMANQFFGKWEPLIIVWMLNLDFAL